MTRPTDAEVKRLKKWLHDEYRSEMRGDLFARNVRAPIFGPERLMGFFEDYAALCEKLEAAERDRDLLAEVWKISDDSHIESEAQVFILRAVSAAHAVGFVAGREAAAAYHDKQADDYRKMTLEDPGIVSDLEGDHRNYAEHIRALPAPSNYAAELQQLLDASVLPYRKIFEDIERDHGIECIPDNEIQDCIRALRRNPA